MEYLVYQPQKSHSSKTSGICLSIAVDNPERTSKSTSLQKEPEDEGKYYRIHKLDPNCDDPSTSQNVEEDSYLYDSSLNAWTVSGSHSHYQTTLSPDPQQKRREQFVLTLEGNILSSKIFKKQFLILLAFDILNKFIIPRRLCKYRQIIIV